MACGVTAQRAIRALRGWQPSEWDVLQAGYARNWHPCVAHLNAKIYIRAATADGLLCHCLHPADFICRNNILLLLSLRGSPLPPSNWLAFAQLFPFSHCFPRCFSLFFTRQIGQISWRGVAHDLNSEWQGQAARKHLHMCHKCLLSLLLSFMRAKRISLKASDVLKDISAQFTCSSSK